ncbi:MAG: glycosyltransferase [Cyclobacteriaceae bacterium]|nr:glycosyltransferase [Cyclobacteriaceae bacterium]
MKRKTILMVITNLNYGGAQRVFYNLSVELSKRYHVVECVFNFDSGHAFKTGNEVYTLDVKAGKSFLGKLYNFYLRCKRLAEIKRKINADVCISHLEGADYINILSRQREKVVCCLHGSKLYDENIEGFTGWLRKSLLIPFLYKRSGFLVAVSRGVRQEFITHFGIDKSKIRYIPNFFYPEEIKQKSTENIPQVWNDLFHISPLTYMTVGRLVRQKNIEGFIRLAAASVRLTRSKWFILGDGELFQSLYAYAKKLGLQVYSWDDTNSGKLEDYDLYFVGYMKNPFAWLKKTDWFILTSGWEGFPMVIGEAMACGTPTISTDCQTGPREFLSDKDYPDSPIVTHSLERYGILIPLLTNRLSDESFNKLAFDLTHLAKDKTLRNQYAEQSNVRIQSFTPEYIVPQWCEVIDN